VWRRPARWGSSHFVKGDRLPADVPRGKLVNLWEAGRIERPPSVAGPVDGAAGDVPASQDEPVTLEGERDAEEGDVEEEEAEIAEEEPVKVGSQWALRGHKFPSRTKALQWLETQKQS
jgi:hypothetical protein